MEPLLLLALGVTLILTGLACSYIAMSIVKKNSEKAISYNSVLCSLWIIQWYSTLDRNCCRTDLVNLRIESIIRNTSNILAGFALEIENLKVYSGGTEALKGISLKVQEGDFYALLGPNGAGKSSTIGIIGTVVTKTSGKVKIFNNDIDNDVAAAKALLGVVSQRNKFFTI